MRARVPGQKCGFSSQSQLNRTTAELDDVARHEDALGVDAPPDLTGPSYLLPLSHVELSWQGIPPRDRPRFLAAQSVHHVPP
jgi:hypothetical protein